MSKFCKKNAKIPKTVDFAHVWSSRLKSVGGIGANPMGTSEIHAWRS